MLTYFLHFFQMIFDDMYKSNSVGDLGTLYQLKCKLNRKDVNEKVNKSYHGCEAFFSTVLDGYVIYAAMEYFGMASASDSPSYDVPIVAEGESSQLFEKVGDMVDTFILHKVQPETELLRDALQDQGDQCQTCHRCRYPGCDKNYIQEKRRDNYGVRVHGIMIQENNAARSPPNPRNEDGDFNYSHNVLKYGLLLRDFQDAMKEGDGGRTEYLWKFLMLMFKVCGKTKYALAAIRLNARLNSLLTPREAHSFKWNRTINLKGGVGRNVAIDQAMEHDIRETKELMYAHGANLNFDSAQTYSRAANSIKDTMRNFYSQNKLREHSTKHKRKKDDDVYTVVDSLKKVSALKEICGRTHNGIGTLPKDPISNLDFHDLSVWLTKHKKNWVNVQ